MWKTHMMLLQYISLNAKRMVENEKLAIYQNKHLVIYSDN